MTRVHQFMRLLGLAAAAGVLAITAAVAQDEGDEPKSIEDMSVEELREYQAYYYPSGGRDPMIMRRATDAELGLVPKEGAIRIPTLEEMENFLVDWLREVDEAVKNGEYAAAIQVSERAIYIIDNEWPEMHADQVELRRMAEEIRIFNRLAVRLKSQEDITAEFQKLQIRVDGVIWSPTDSKAVVNGKTLSAGELMLDERSQGDLRIEMIEEHGVVFQFKGMRFRIPVEIYSNS